MTTGVIAFLVVVVITGVSISAVLFMQQWVNKQLRDHDRQSNERLKALEDWKDAQNEKEKDSNPYLWLTKTNRS